MIQADFTVTPITGDVYATKFVATNLTTRASVKRTVWNFGTDELYYNTNNPSHVYSHPGIYTISLTAIDFDNNISTKSIQITAELPYRDYLTFTQIPESFPDPGTVTKTPFKMEVLSTNLNDPLLVDLFAVNSKSTPTQFIPTKWNFLNPTWKFLDKNLSVITTLSVEPIPIYKNNTIVAVSGTAEFYYVDSIGVGNLTGDCNPLLITATLQTSSYSNSKDSEIFSYNSFANNQTVRAGIIWLVNDTYPNLLKITANYVDEIYSKQWSGIKIPIMITCHSNKALILPGAEDATSEPIFTYPSNNEIGNIYPIKVTLSNLLTGDYTIDEDPLYFQALDKNGNRIGGYIFTTITINTTATDTTVVAKTTAFNNLQNFDSNKFSYPFGYTPFPVAWISNPERNTLNKVTLVPYPAQCSTIEAYKATGNLLDGIIKEIPVPFSKTQETINYEMSGFSGIYGVAVDPRFNDVIACDAELDRLYRINTFGEIIKTFELSSLGDFNPYKKMFENWTWTAISPLSTSSGYALYNPTIISPSPANYIVTVNGLIQPADAIEVNAYNRVIRLIRPFYEFVALSAAGLPLSSISPFQYPPENAKVEALQIFNPTLPTKYISTLYYWTTSSTSTIQTLKLSSNPFFDITNTTSYTSLCTNPNNYFVTLSGLLQHPNTYTINAQDNTITFSTPVQPNTLVYILYAPAIPNPVSWTRNYNFNTNIFSLEYEPNFVNDLRSSFIVNINGVIQSPDTYTIDIPNKQIIFNTQLPQNVPITVTQYSLPDNSYNPAAYTPTYVSLDKDYNIWVSLFNSVSVLKFDENFNLLHTAIPNNIEWLKRAWTVLPKGIGYQSAQFEIDSRYESASSDNADIYTNEFFLKPPVVETDQQNNCWVSYAHPLCSLLVKYSSTGQVLSEISLKDYTMPINLAVSPKNNIWVANFHGSSYTYTSLSGSLQLYDTTTSALLSTITGFSRPGHLSLDRDGNLWFTHSLRRIGYLNTESAAISMWTLTLSGTFTPYTIPSSVQLSGLAGFDAFENSEDDELGGLTVDVYNRVWIIDSVQNQAWVLSASPYFNQMPIRNFKIRPDSNIGYVLNLDNSTTYTISGDYYKSAQATGDWTGNRWYQKYARPQTLSAVSLSGISNSFNVHEFKNTAQIRKINESFNTAEYYKSLALPENLNANTILFDKFFAATVGTGMLSSNEDIGQKVYERTANFNLNHGDIDTCNIDQLLSFADETAVPAQDYGLFLPTELRNLLDVASISKTRLWGFKDEIPKLKQSIGKSYNTQTDYVTAGTKIVLRSKFDGALGLFSVPQLSSNELVYPLSSIKLYGLVEPIFTNYIFYQFNPVYSDEYINNIIDWNSPYTTLDKTLSTYEDWYGEDGALETAFRYLLTKSLFLK